MNALVGLVRARHREAGFAPQQIECHAHQDEAARDLNGSHAHPEEGEDAQPRHREDREDRERNQAGAPAARRRCSTQRWRPTQYAH